MTWCLCELLGRVAVRKKAGGWSPASKLNAKELKGASAPLQTLFRLQSPRMPPWLVGYLPYAPYSPLRDYWDLHLRHARRARAIFAAAKRARRACPTRPWAVRGPVRRNIACLASTSSISSPMSHESHMARRNHLRHPKSPIVPRTGPTRFDAWSSRGGRPEWGVRDRCGRGLCAPGWAPTEP